MVYLVKRFYHHRYSDKDIYVVKPIGDGNFVAYHFSRVKNESSRILPKTEFILKDDSIDIIKQIASNVYHDEDITVTVCESHDDLIIDITVAQDISVVDPDTSEVHNIRIPADYTMFEDVQYSLKKGSSVSDEIFKAVRKEVIVNMGTSIRFASKNALFKDKQYMDVDRVRKYFCVNCKSYFTVFKDYVSIYDFHHKCQCHKKQSWVLELADYANYGLNNSVYSFSGLYSTIKFNHYYVKFLGNGVKVYAVTYTIGNKRGNVIIEEIKVNGILTYIIDDKGTTLSCVSDRGKDLDPFKAFNINTKTLYSFNSDTKFEGYDSFEDFVISNKDFMSKCGFIDLIKSSSRYFSVTNFILFLAINVKYSVIEQLIKMGHTNIYCGIIDNIFKACNISEIDGYVKELSKLINIDETEGKKMLRVPHYVGLYLKSINADLNTYYFYCDLYELTKFSRDEFESLINSIDYVIVFSMMSNKERRQFLNIIKYGYKVSNLISYIIKESRGIGITTTIQLLYDYLYMCELMNVAPSLYVNNLVNAHDRMSEVCKEFEDAENNKELGVLAAECSEYVIPKDADAVGVNPLFKKYSVVFPESINDFIEEGNQQNNCVGGYAKRVLSGDCIIFFVRDINDLDKSLITAECSKDGLEQYLYSNNRIVCNEEQKVFGNYIANKLVVGCRSGKIHGLCNVKAS